MGTNPVSVRKIDTDGSCRIQVTGKNSGSDHLGRYPFYLFLFERFINRRMIFEPLRIAADNLCTVCSIQVFEVDQ